MTKESLRKAYRQKRQCLSKQRRDEAASSLAGQILRLLAKAPFQQGPLLSFASFRDEIDLMALNAQLAAQGRLLLPKREGSFLKIFHVPALNALTLTSWGLYEPNPLYCQEVSSLLGYPILVPGLAFDVRGHRLGYGRGYYDRFLANTAAFTLGVGFKEQLHPVPLPTRAADIPLQQLLLV